MNNPVWWRCELSPDGKIVSCVAVDMRPDTPDGAVVYVLAETEDVARFKAYKERQKVVQRERRERYRSEGKCAWCGRDREEPQFNKCRVCRERNRVHRARSDGKLPPLKPGEKGARIQERRLELRDMVRLEVLLEVTRTLMELRDVRAFRAWLSGQIKGMGGRDKAA
jgi:hypothetical protein